jgi:O-antigen/teichoic acid export membrane protein
VFFAILLTGKDKHQIAVYHRVLAFGDPTFDVKTTEARKAPPTLEGRLENTRNATPRLLQATRNVLANWLTYLVGGVVSFFLSPFIVRHLGNSAYGIWVLLVSLTGYLGFLDLGIRGAVTRYVAKFHTERKHDESSRTISSATGLFVGAGILAILTSVIFAFIAVPHFKIPTQYLRTAQVVVVITGLNIAISLVSGVFGGVLVGLQRFDLTNAIAVSGIAFRAVAVVLALKNGHGLVTLALIQLAGTFAELVAGIMLARQLYPEARVSSRGLSHVHVSLIFSFGFFAFLLNLSNYLIYYTDALVIGAFLPISMVTFFSIGSNLTIYARDLVGGFSRTMTPMASKLEVEAGLSGVQETTLKAARLCALIMWPIFITFIIRGRTFIGLWMGPSYVDLSGHVLWILSIPWLFGAGVSVIASAVLGVNKHKPVVPAALAEALGNLALSIVLVKPMGVVGVAWGTAIPNLAANTLFWPWYSRRALGIPIRAYVRSVLLVPFAATVPFSICTYLVDRFWAVHTLAFFFFQGVTVVPVAGLSIWYFGLTAKERASFVQRLVPVSGPSSSRPSPAR